MSSTVYAIEATDLTHHIGSFVLDWPDWSVSPGECIVLHGPNGAGKTTMLKLLAGIYRPYSGGIRICGYDLWRESLRAKSLLGYVSVLPQTVRHLTGREFVTFIAGLYPGAPSRDNDMLVTARGLPILLWSHGNCAKIGAAL